MPDKYTKLEQLQHLRDNGTLTEEEFQIEKAKVLQTSESTNPFSVASGDFWGMDENTFALLLHLATFGNYVTGMLGTVLQIVMWITCKDQSAKIDNHGRVVINATISYFIYLVVCIVIGICTGGIALFLLIPLFLLTIIFPIVGAIKANDGEVWPYPLSITFLQLIDDATHSALNTPPPKDHTTPTPPPPTAEDHTQGDANHSSHGDDLTGPKEKW